jgi:hypothetical protein
MPHITKDGASMTQQISRLNLTNYNFPLLSTGIGKSIVLGSKLDVPADTVAGQRSTLSQPQLIYAENLLPTTEGYRSCKFTALIPAAIPAVTNFSEIYNVASSDGALGWFCPANGTNQLWKGTTWAVTSAFGAGKETSHANITGQSYVCYEYTGIKKINITAGTITSGVDASDTLVGILAANIKGICAAGNYMIAYDEERISWSSPTNLMDFTPSLVTGAGSAIPTDLKGRIVAVLQNASGFVIYTTQNMVAATYSGNASYPWVFKHIPGSSGLQSGYDKVTEAISDVSIAWTADGLHQVSATGVTPILADVTDFLQGRILESYNAGTGVITETLLTADIKMMLHQVSERYLAISYGSTDAPFSNALIFDAALKRWGKVTVPHIEVIALPSSQATADRELCFVAADGSVQQLSMEATNTTASGVAIFGRITTTRTSSLTMQRVSVESVKATDVFTCKLGTSYVGGRRQDVISTLTGTNVGGIVNFPCRLTGAAHYVHLAGMLNLTSLEVAATQAGVR